LLAQHLFYPEDRGCMLLQNTDELLDYTAWHPRWQNSSYALLWEVQI
jgi:hypothetical protein